MDGYLVASFACLLVIMLNTEGSLALCSVNPSVKGIQVLKQRKAEARVNRITSLLSSVEELSSANRKELNSLLRCDTYDPTVFSESHRLFKLNQNKVFSTLGLYCSNENSVIGESERSMFYLDGSLGETTKALRLAGFLDLELYTANIFENTANSLKNEHRVHTYHGRAHDSLLSDFLDIPFCSYYLDGCSGSSRSIVDMINSIFTDSRLSPSCLSSQVQSSSQPITPMETDDDVVRTVESADSVPSLKQSIETRESKGKGLNCFSIGFTLTNAGGTDSRSLVDREQEVTKCICLSGRKYGYVMSYVGDNPGIYGLESSPLKRDGDVQTTWVVLSR